MTSKPSKCALFVMVLAILLNAIFTTPVAAQEQQDNLKFVMDVTVPDNTVMTPGQQFTKTWRVMNTGSTTWSPQYSFNYTLGEYMTAVPVVQNMPSNVAPQNTIDLSVTMTAPQTPGSYTGFWQMRNAIGIAFGPMIWVSILVSDGSIPTSSSISSATSQTPMPQNFDIRTISPSMVEFYFNGQWVQSTPPALDGNMQYPGISGTISYIEYDDCHYEWSWTTWSFVNKCEKRQLLIQDLGIHPFKTLSHEGEVAFYSYLNGLTFGMVGTVMGGTLQGTNGYLIYEVGKASGLTSTSIIAATARFSLPVLVVSYAYYAGKVYVVAHPINEPVAIAAPIAPITISMEIPQNYVMTQIDVEPRKGSSIGKIEGDLVMHTWVIMSLDNMCSLWMKASMPKADMSELLSFEEKDDNIKNRPCNLFDIVRFMLKIGQRAFKAGVSLDVIKQFYNDVLSKIAIDLHIPVNGNFISELLGL